MNLFDYNFARKLFAGLVLFFVIIGTILPEELRSGWFAGYGVGLLTIFLHYATSSYSGKWYKKRFLLFYISAMIIRFLIVLGIFIILLIMEKFDQLSFTVSFLFSYICHSLINIILLNKELTNRLG